MNKVKDFFLRFGPLVAAALLGVNGAFPGLDGIFLQVSAIFALLGSAADPEFVAVVAEVVVGATALLGVVRKAISLVQKYIST